MAKAQRLYVCQTCGATHNKWAGKCEACGEWNTLVEEGTAGGIGSGPGALKSARKGRAVALTSLDGDIEDAPTFGAGIHTEFLLGIGKAGGRVKLLLDIDKVLATSELAALEAAQAHAD